MEIDSNVEMKNEDVIEKAAAEKRCYTVGELQDILMCGRGTVYDLIKQNLFRTYKLGGSGYRISKKSFDEWLDSRA